MESDAEPLAQRGLAPGPTVRVTVGLDDGAHGSAFGHAAPDEALDAVLGHEVHAARGRALDRLPALHGVNGPRHQGEVLQIVAAIRDAGGNGVVLAVVGERGVVERLEDDLDLLLEDLAVGPLIEQVGQIARLGTGGDEGLVRKYAAVHGGAAVADVVHVQVAGVQAVELGDHGPPSTPPYHIRAGPVASVSARSATPSAHAAGPT